MKRRERQRDSRNKYDHDYR